MSSLGNKLRDARIEKGYTLNTLQQMTKIQKKYLVAIEEGKFNELPGVFYVRAFVKQYADVVGLNGDDLLATYEDEIELTSAEELAPVIENIETEELGSRVKARQDNLEKDHTEILLSYLPLAFLVGIILMIIFSLIMAINRMNSSQSSTDIENVTSTAIVSTVSPETVVVTTESQSTESGSSTQTLADNQIRVGNKVLTKISEDGEETVYEVEGANFDGYTFGANGLSYVWVGMYEDESMVVDTTISADEDFEYTVNAGVTSFRMRLGYPDGGTFKVNGTELELNNDFFPDTVVFRIKEGAATETEPVTEAASSSVDDASDENSDTSETTEYEGPAVYRNREGRD